MEISFKRKFTPRVGRSPFGHFDNRWCVFCGRRAIQNKNNQIIFVSGNHGSICSECIELSQSILEQDRRQPTTP